MTTAVTKPMQCAFIVDTHVDQLASWSPAFVYKENLDPFHAWCTMGFPHNGMGNVLFVDGHTESNPNNKMSTAVAYPCAFILPWFVGKAQFKSGALEVFLLRLEMTPASNRKMGASESSDC